MPSLTLNTLTMDVTPGLLNASASGYVSGKPVSIQLSSITDAANFNLSIGSIRVNSSSGASLDALLAGQAAAVSADVGMVVPTPPSGGYVDSDGQPASAVLVFDSLHGLRMLTFTLSGASRVGVSDLARRLGFAWQGASDQVDPISFSAPWLYYVPAKPNATNITWAGRQLVGPELGVAATVDVPSLGINATRGTLLVQPGGKLSLKVRGW